MVWAFGKNRRVPFGQKGVDGRSQWGMGFHAAILLGTMFFRRDAVTWCGWDKLNRAQLLKIKAHGQVYGPRGVS